MNVPMWVGRPSVSLVRGSHSSAFSLAIPVLLGALVVGCGDKGPKTEAGPTAPAVVPEPAGLVAEMFMAKPGTTWTRARTLVGGPAMMLPAMFPQAASMLLGLPAAAGDQLDADIPALGAVVLEGEHTYTVMAFHVKDGPRIVSMATTGPEATFVSKVDAPSSVTILEQKPGAPARPMQLGVAGNYLLVSMDKDGLIKVGPHVTRNMPTKTVPTDDVAILARQQAIAGPIKTKLSSWWTNTKNDLQAADKQAREQHGGAAPTFGDPAGAVEKADVTFQSLFAILADLSEAKITLNLDETGVHTRAALRAASTTGPASQEFAAMVLGDPKPLLDLPRDVSMAMMLRDSKDIRARSVADQIDSFDKVLAGKMSADDKKKLQEVLDGWSKGRGDWLMLGGAISANGNAVYARSAVADGTALDRGIRGLLDLPKVPAFAEPIQHWIGETKITPPGKADKPDATMIAKIDRKPPSMKVEGHDVKRDPDKFEVGWVVNGDVASYVVAGDSKAALGTLAEAPKAENFGAEPSVKQAIESLGTDTSTVLVLLPMRLISGLMTPPSPKKRATPAAPPAPVVLALGRSDAGAYLRIDAATEAVREFIKMQMQGR